MKAMGKALEDIYTLLYAIRELLGAKESEVDLPTDSDMTPVGIMICFLAKEISQKDLVFANEMYRCSFDILSDKLAKSVKAFHDTYNTLITFTKKLGGHGLCFGSAPDTDPEELAFRERFLEHYSKHVTKHKYAARKEENQYTFVF